MPRIQYLSRVSSLLSAPRTRSSLKISLGTIEIDFLLLYYYCYYYYFYGLQRIGVMEYTTILRWPVVKVTETRECNIQFLRHALKTLPKRIRLGGQSNDRQKALIHVAEALISPCPIVEIIIENKKTRQALFIEI